MVEAMEAMKPGPSSERMHKLGHFQGGEWVEHVHPAVYEVSPPGGANQRVVAGVPRGDPEVFGSLVASLAPPLHLLYVLHTPRGEGAAGRYQTPALGAEDVHAFLTRFSSFLSADARFDIWAHSPGDGATVVWDRHNQVFAYGPLTRFEFVLQRLGFERGSVEMPSPHQHHYRAEFDEEASGVLHAFAWRHTPLQDGDEQ